jgi:serine-type D-Ala-D-Ala carboxypeptidase (penicillin-binding protein 5/6)
LQPSRGRAPCGILPAVSLLLDDGPRRRTRRRHSRATYARRRIAAVAALVVLTCAGVLLLHAESGVRDEGPAQAQAAPAPSPEPAAPAIITELDRWHGYGERLSPRRERLDVRFGKDAPRAGMVFDVRSGRVLWARSPRTELPIASLTKMMTAILVADAVPEGAEVPITREALDYEGSGVGMFKRGQRIDVETMLYGLLLPSGNDAAIALAQRVSGTQARFVALMNRSARELDLSCTRFASPSGIVDAGNYSCPRDLARLAREVLRRPRLARIVATEDTSRPFPGRDKKGRPRRIWLSNNNTLMRRDYDGVTGVKTGYTNAAGSCLVATVRRGGRQLGVVLLKSPGTGAQGARLLDAAFRRIAR